MQSRNMAVVGLCGDALRDFGPTARTCAPLSLSPVCVITKVPLLGSSFFTLRDFSSVVSGNFCARAFLVASKAASIVKWLIDIDEFSMHSRRCHRLEANFHKSKAAGTCSKAPCLELKH